MLLRAIGFMLMVFVGGSWCLTAATPPQEAVEEHLRFLVSQRPLVYAALYGLPETADAFAAVAEDRAWSAYIPVELPGLLSTNEQDRIITAVAAQLAVFTEAELEKFFERLRAWLLAHDQLSVFGGLTSLEQTMSAAFALPWTQHAFDVTLENRRLNPEEVEPQTVGETLASAEVAAITYDLLRIISSLSQHEQLEYYRDIYNQLLKLLEGKP